MIDIMEIHSFIESDLKFSLVQWKSFNVIT